MLIRGLEIENLKSIKNIKMECSDLNLLIGINSSGKSSVLQGLLLVSQNMEQECGLNGSFVSLEYPYRRPVICAEVNGRCYADEALCNNGLSEADMVNILESVPRLIEDLENGRKTDLWDKLQEDIFELRMHVSSGRIFRLLFTQYHGICFLNGFIKKTQKAPVNEIRKAVEIKKQITKVL